MSSLVIRMGNNCKNIHKRLHRGGFIPSLKSFQDVEIAEMSSCSTVSEESELNKTESGIYILEDLVTKTANSCIRSRIPDGRWCFQKSKNVKNLPDFNLDWSDVVVIPEKPHFKPIHLNEEAKDVIRIISSTILKNESKVAQWHKVKTERPLVSACESTLLEGCVIGREIEIPLPAPDVIGFSAGFSFRRAVHTFNKENIAWTGTQCIKIPKGDTITITTQLKEQRKEFNFTALIGVRGHVHVILNHPDMDTAVKFPISVGEVLRKEMPKLITKEENNTVYFKIKGSCKFRYDVEHEVIINST